MLICAWTAAPPHATTTHKTPDRHVRCPIGQLLEVSLSSRCEPVCPRPQPQASPNYHCLDDLVVRRNLKQRRGRNSLPRPQTCEFLALSRRQGAQHAHVALLIARRVHRRLRDEHGVREPCIVQQPPKRIRPNRPLTDML